MAVLADSDVGASDSVVKASGSVERAGLICHFIGMHELESAQGPSSMASLIELTARDNDLWRDVDVWPLCISGDLYSVRQG